MAAGGARAGLGSLGGERRAERGAVARGPAECGDERRDPGRRRAALERGQRVGERGSERDRLGGAVELAGERAGVSAADLRERTTR